MSLIHLVLRLRMHQAIPLLIKNKLLYIHLTKLLFFILVQLHVSVILDHRRAIVTITQSDVKNA